jgi:hypothetical protein
MSAESYLNSTYIFNFLLPYVVFTGCRDSVVENFVGELLFSPSPQKERF